MFRTIHRRCFIYINYKFQSIKHLGINSYPLKTKKWNIMHTSTIHASKKQNFPTCPPDTPKSTPKGNHWSHRSVLVPAQMKSFSGNRCCNQDVSVSGDSCGMMETRFGGARPLKHHDNACFQRKVDQKRMQVTVKDKTSNQQITASLNYMSETS